MSFELKVWKAGDRRAVYKPLLLLWMLGQYFHNQLEEFQFVDICVPVKRLFEEFGALNKVYYPFWRLQNDGILNFPQKEKIRESDSGDAVLEDLRKYGNANFTEEFSNSLRLGNLKNFCFTLLDEYFPPSLHEDILRETELQNIENKNFQKETIRNRRDPNFRKVVSTAYNYECAICSFSLLLNGVAVANEAAHIKWHAYAGPNIVQNGMLLCSLHHKLFDRGILGIDNNMKVIVSNKISGSNPGIDRWLFEYVEQRINLPRNKNDYPSEQYLSWHRKEVFME